MSTLAEMNTLIAELKNVQAQKKKAEDYAASCENTMKEIRSKILKLLEDNGLENYAVPGVGRVHIQTQESFTTPKSNDEKQQLFEYIKQKYGEEDLVSKLSIHSATLNAWAKQEMEANSSDPIFRIPGLSEPTAFKKLSFREAK